MFPEMALCLRRCPQSLAVVVFGKKVRGPCAHGSSSFLSARRSFSISRCSAAKVRPVNPSRERVEIPGLPLVTYGDRMHFVPGLSKPSSQPQWEKDYKDPRRYRSPPSEEMPLHRDKPCFIYSQRTSALEGTVLDFNHVHFILTNERSMC